MAANDLVRVRFNGVEMNLGKAHAESLEDAEILNEPTTNPDGSLRGETRSGGRPIKPHVDLRTLTVDQLSEHGVAVLKAEIDARNDARGSEDDRIVVDSPGNKPQLVAALAADNDNQKEQDQ